MFGGNFIGVILRKHKNYNVLKYEYEPENKYTSSL